MHAPSEKTPTIRIEPPDTAIIQVDSELRVSVRVPSLSRAECYLPHIARALLTIHRQLPHPEPLASVRTSEAHPPRLPGVESSILQVNSQKVLSECALNLVHLFDQQLMIYQHNDICSYRETHSLPDSALDRLSSEEATRRFNEYLQDRIQKKGSYLSYLTSTFPNINILLQRVSINFCNNISQALGRTQRDLHLLQRDLLGSLNGTVILSNIHITNSDLHKKGQQVLILEFTNSRNEKKLVVYKPSSVLADAFLIGDMQRLGVIDPDFSGCNSLLNIMNSHIAQIKEYTPLPLYLIIPRLDGNSDNISSHYGYLEYVTHEPWQEADYVNAVQESLRNRGPTRPGQIDSAQRSVNQHFIRFLSAAARDPDCDFIARTPQEVNIYSRDCGLLLALLVSVGGSDLHCQNLIIQRRRPVLIDVEACFTRAGLTPASTACFDNMVGAIRSASANYETVRCLVDICGIEQKTIVHLEKNRMFRLFHQVGDQLVACQPDIRLFMEGYELGLQAITANKAQLHNWLSSLERFNIPTRVLPYGTSEFREELRSLCTSDFLENIYTDKRAQRLLNESPEYDEDLREYNEMEQQNRLFTEMPSPFFAIYLHNDPETNMYNEYRTLNIPYYYTRINERSLRDFNNQIVRVPTHPLTESHLTGGESIATTNDFFPESSFLFIRNRLENIANNPQLRARMIEIATEESQGLSEMVTDTNDLTVINLIPINPSATSSVSPWPKQPANRQSPRGRPSSAKETDPLIRREDRRDESKDDSNDKDNGNCCRLS